MSVQKEPHFPSTLMFPYKTMQTGGCYTAHSDVECIVLPYKTIMKLWLHPRQLVSSLAREFKEKDVLSSKYKIQGLGEPKDRKDRALNLGKSETLV